MSSNVKLGQLLIGGEKRDAVHIAIAPVIAGERLEPGQRVGLLRGSIDTVHVCDMPVGIIDPYLAQPVQPDERCWLFLFPDTITGLRHKWTHPAFDSNLADSIAWLKNYAYQLSPYEASAEEAYDRLVDGITLEQTVYAHGSDLHGLEELDRPEEFFGHLAIVLGRPIDRNSLTYTCSC